MLEKTSDRSEYMHVQMHVAMYTSKSLPSCKSLLFRAEDRVCGYDQELEICIVLYSKHASASSLLTL